MCVEYLCEPSDFPDARKVPLGQMGQLLKEPNSEVREFPEPWIPGIMVITPLVLNE